MLPKSERVVPGTFSGYGTFPKRGSKFQSATIYIYKYVTYLNPFAGKGNHPETMADFLQ